MAKTILHITPFFAPNIGGVETHLTDLTTTLASLNYQNIILTYSPITTNSSYQPEESHKNILIRRFSWLGHNLFYRLEKYPLLNFLYLTPYLLLRAYCFLLSRRPPIDTVHSHGLNSALIGLLLKSIFKYKKHIVSIYSSYDNVPFNSFSTRLFVYVLNHCDVVLTQSDRSIIQLIALGVHQSKLHRYYHWIDTARFVPTTNKIPHTILFVGRLNPAKNALTLAKCAPLFPSTTFNFIGTGPDYNQLLAYSKKYSNIKLLGDVPYSQLHQHYSQNSLLCIPSKYDEGWGRVIIESLSCGTPVIASNLGAIPEVVDDSVAILIKPTTKNIAKAIKYLSINKNYLSLQKNTRSYAIKHFSAKNIDFITRHY